jgi:hypothetical protein
MAAVMVVHRVETFLPALEWLRRAHPRIGLGQ